MAVEISPAVWDHAIRVFGDAEKAYQWMHTPLPALDGRTPVTVFDENPAAIDEILDRIEDGVFG